MAEENQDDFCEEPDANFFDTFFDDGVLEAIGQVCKYDSADEDICHVSACEEEENPSKESNDCREGNQSPNLKSPALDNTKVTSKEPDALTANSSSVEETYGKAMGTSVATSEALQFPNSNDENKGDLSIDELLARVKACLNSGPLLNLPAKTSLRADSPNLKNNTTDYEAQKKDVGALVKQYLKNPSALMLQGHKETDRKSEESLAKDRVHINPSQKPEVSELARPKDNFLLGVEVSHVLAPTNLVSKEDSTNKMSEESESRKLSDLSLVSSSSLEASPPKSSSSDIEPQVSKNKTLEENFLVHDETKGVSQPSSSKKKKIQINLKSQLLAPTTILNSDSSSTRDVPTSSKSKKVEDGLDKSEKKREKLGRKKKDDLNRESMSRDEGILEHKSKSKKNGKKKKSRDDSPVSKRRREKESKSRRRRSRSRSTSPHARKKYYKRRKSPDRTSYLKHVEVFSRSPSKSPARNFRKRYSRSPIRGRSRSPSPIIRRSRSPRSRSRSPFINEINRLRKRWAIEDNAKKTSQLATTIVSNMVQVQVHHHSTAFSVANSLRIPPPYQPNPSASNPFLMEPHPPNPFQVPFVGQDFSQCHDQSTYALPSSVFPALPEVPGMINTPEAAMPNVNMISSSTVSGLSSATLPISMPPDTAPICVTTPPPIGPASTSEQQTSLLRKQLDILMSTVVKPPNVVNLPVSSTGVESNKKQNPRQSLVPVTCLPSIPVDNGDPSIQTCRSPKKKAIPQDKDVSPVDSSTKMQLPSNPSGPSQDDETKDNQAKSKKESSPSNPISIPSSSVEGYDSDVIIEEVPEKSPPDVICLSGDDSDELYNLDNELAKIRTDTLNSSQEECVDKKKKTVDKKKEEKKRKRKRKRDKKHDGSSDEIIRSKKKETRDGGKQKGCEPVSLGSELDNDNTVLRECHEMIDSLRIGRFVVTDESQADEDIPFVSSIGVNLSVLSKREKTAFSYTQSPDPEVVPKKKDQCTNTQFQLCIDVSTNTDISETHDISCQTDLDCSGCNEKKELIKAMNAQLLRVKKERDDLLQLVLEIGRSRLIPGLDSSSGLRKSRNFSSTESNLASPGVCPSTDIRQRQILQETASNLLQQKEHYHSPLTLNSGQNHFDSDKYFDSKASL